MKIKFCGIRRMEDVEYINILQPDYMGMILANGFQRTISAELAKNFISCCSNHVKTVGVFVNQSIEEILQTVKIAPVDVIQLHGKEDNAYISQLRENWQGEIWKAVRVQSAEDIRKAEQLGADHLILEGYVPNQIGGTGVTADWNLIAHNKPKQSFFLAGGLTPDNMKKAISLVQPQGLDFSSGIETNKAKDFEKMKAIIEIIRGDRHE